MQLPNSQFVPGIYRHFKGHIYRALGIARHSETLEPLVVYTNINDNSEIWVRPLNMFLDSVTIDGKTVPRFSLIR